MLLQFLINGLVTGLLYSLLAIGFALVYNTTHVFHIAAAGLYVFAAYLFWALSSLCGLPLIISATLAVALTMGLSLLCEVGLYRPLRRRNASPSVVMVASLGLMTVIVNVIAICWGNQTRVVSNAILRTYSLGGAVLTTPQICQIVVSLVSIALFLVLLERTRFGVGIRAVSDDEALFEALGFDRRRTYCAAFLASGALIGLASCATVFDTGLDPNMGMGVLVNAMVAMIIGGTGRFGTCIAGGLVLGVLQSLTVMHFSAGWQNAVTFALLLVFLFLRPQGIAGFRQRVV